MSDLFEGEGPAMRQRLRDLGWKRAEGLQRGGPLMWRRPDGARVTEEEAFRQLEALESLERGVSP